MAVNDDKDVFTFTGFLGLRNTASQESFEVGDLVTALNVDVTDSRRLRRRSGFSTAKSVGSYHSLWSDGSTCLVVGAGTLYLVSTAYALTALRTGLSLGRFMSYAAVGDRIFYANGIECGVVQDRAARTWGIDTPAAPAAAIIPGDLPNGRYQATMTYVRADGQESGAQRAVHVDLTSTTEHGLMFTMPVSSDSGVSRKRLYVTPADGDAFYLLGDYANTETIATYTAPRTFSTPLATQFLGPPPAGDELGYFAGHLYVAVGDRVYRSEPFAPELFDLRKSQAFSSKVTLVAPVTDGIYYGTEDSIFWVGGKDPERAVLEKVADYGVHRGTLAYGPADAVAEGAKGMAAFFASHQGLCFAPPSGALVNLTSARFNYPPMDRGAGVVRDVGGTSQYLAVLQGDARSANTAF